MAGRLASMAAAVSYQPLPARRTGVARAALAASAATALSPPTTTSCSGRSRASSARVLSGRRDALVSRSGAPSRAALATPSASGKLSPLAKSTVDAAVWACADAAAPWRSGRGPRAGRPPRPSHSQRRPGQRRRPQLARDDRDARGSEPQQLGPHRRGDGGAGDYSTGALAAPDATRASGWLMPAAR